MGNKSGFHSPVEGKTKSQLFFELKAVYDVTPEFANPAYGGGDFMQMVKKFASDELFRLHLVAKAYLELKD